MGYALSSPPRTTLFLLFAQVFDPFQPLLPVGVLGFSDRSYGGGADRFDAGKLQGHLFQHVVRRSVIHPSVDPSRLVQGADDPTGPSL